MDVCIVKVQENITEIKYYFTSNWLYRKSDYPEYIKESQ